MALKSRFLPPGRLCCFRVQNRYIHRVLREQRHAVVSERAGKARMRRR